jgi:MFS family permease
MSQNEKPTAAFALSLIAGIFILVNGVLMGFVGSFLAEFVPGFIPAAEYTPEAAAGLAIASTVLYAFMAVGIIFGVLVLLGAIMVYRNPSQKTAWGVIILVFSILSIVIGGGFLIGFILGIIGGALTLAWKPKTTAEPTTAPATPETTAT